MIELSSMVFYALTFLIVAGASSVLLFSNPIYCALSLAVTMISLGFMYIQLEAFFIASVQLIVYAGAVMVLFVMVLMLFDLRNEDELIETGRVGSFLKLLCAIVFTAIVTWTIKISLPPLFVQQSQQTAADQMGNIKLLAGKLFTQYVFAFEALGVLLLLIAIGVVAISRTRGGTHARD